MMKKHYLQPLLSLVFLYPYAVAVASVVTMDEAFDMRGSYGMYPLSRESSGTSWQPDTTPVTGTVKRYNELTLFYDGFINGGYIAQSGKRGDDGSFTTSMFTVRAQHPLEDGIFGARLRFSLDPLNGSEGYPLLLQNGGSSNGRDRLIDREVPNDALSEMAASFSFPLSEESSGFVYAGYPGEPALGAPDYTHRYSGASDPVAPLSRRWLDSTRTCYGVLTTGYTTTFTKLEASVFDGQEPDQSHWNVEFEHPKFKSYSGRAAFSLSPIIVWDFSVGHLSEPDRLRERVDVNRLTSFLSWNIIGEKVKIQTSLGWGRNIADPGTHTDAYLIESTLNLGKWQTYFGRVERAEMDGLFTESDARARTVYKVYKAEVGYIHDFALYGSSVWGVGGSLALNFLPASLKDTYGDRVPGTLMIFVRAKL